MGHWGPPREAVWEEVWGSFCQCGLCCGLHTRVCLCADPYQLWIFIDVLFLCLGACAGRGSILSLWPQVPHPQLEQQIPRGLLGRG